MKERFDGCGPKIAAHRHSKDRALGMSFGDSLKCGIDFLAELSQKSPLGRRITVEYDVPDYVCRHLSENFTFMIRFPGHQPPQALANGFGLNLRGPTAPANSSGSSASGSSPC